MPRLLRFAAPAVALATAFAVSLIGTPASAQTTEQKLPYTTAAAKDPDTKATTLGTQFTVAVPGKVVGVEFFRVDSQNKASTVQLWGAGSIALATASGVPSATGWVRKDFTTPVTVSPGTAYIASYFAPTGKYSHLLQGFSAARTAGDLTAPVGAGLYRYANNAAKPTSLYQNEDYYVTPIFVPDTTPPPTSTTTPPPPPSAVCDDGQDNDGDGKTDFPADPGCTDAADADETDPVTPPPGDGACPPLPAYPDANCTGAKGELAPSGSITVSTDGAVVENKLVTGYIRVNAANVTIRNVKIVSTDFWPLLTTKAGTLIEDVTVTGSANSQAAIATDVGGTTIRRVDLSGTADGIKIADDSLVEDSYIHDLASATGLHNDAVEFNGSAGITVRHNAILNQNSQTSAVYIRPNGLPSPSSNVLVQDNLLAGGGYTVYGPDSDPPGPSSNVRVVGNKFSVRFFPQSGSFGPSAYWETGPGNDWSGNVWADGPNVGQSVPA